MIVALIGQKGGIGKSTVAISLACCALERGSRVLLVDADPQGTVRTWADIAAEAGHALPTVVAMGAAMHKPDQLPALSRGYDVTLIDCPPRHGDVQRAALMTADVAVLPCGPSAADAWALATTLEVVNEARTLRDHLQACVLLTRKQGRTALGKGARQALTASGLPVLKTELGLRIAYQEAIAAGMAPTTFAPRDMAAHEVRALFDEVFAFGRADESPSGVFNRVVGAG
jgi:chromosome partitioning protein